MRFASNQAYFKRKTNAQQAQERDQLRFRPQVDTNVVGIDFEILKDPKDKMHQGDPIRCTKCDSVLNKYSKVLSQQAYLQLVQPEKQEKMVEEESKNQQKQGFVPMDIEVQANESVWQCEFCGHANKIMIEKEEYPQGEDVVYMVQSVQQVQQQKQNLQAEQTVILCIDNSGSMSTTTEVKGKINLKHGISAEEYEMLKQFIEPGDENQMFPGLQQPNVTHVSRKQCVLAAIESQVNDMKQSSPNKIVGLVTFNNEVVLVGDGANQPITIAGDRLGKAADIRTISQQNAAGLLSKPVHVASEALLSKFQKIQEKGQTALGPALLASVQLAKQGQPGSMVIVCTDGLANLGLGAFDGSTDLSEAAKSFYGELALEAKNSGIAISVVTIKGEGCRMDVLGQLSEQTNGNVTRVNPSDIGKDFASILKDEVVGTQVILVVKMHNALKFRNEDEGVSEDGQTLKKEVGNATVNTQITFEYELKTDEELQQVGAKIAELKVVPFQARIQYTNLNGDKLLRVITKMVSTTEDLKKAEREAKVDIIHTRIQQETAKHVRRGSYQRAQEYNVQWDQYVQSNEVMNMDQSNQLRNADFAVQNLKLQKVAGKQEKRKMKATNSKQAVVKEADKKEESEGFFAKLFGGSKKEQPKAPEARSSRASQPKQAQKPMRAVSCSESDEDEEEVQVQQFIMAKKK